MSRAKQHHPIDPNNKLVPDTEKPVQSIKLFVSNATDSPIQPVDIDCRANDSPVDIGTLCEIYSRSSSKWYSGTVIDVMIDSATKHRWFTISYKNNTKIKKIQRFSKNLRFIDDDQTEAQTPPNLGHQTTETSINLTIFKQHKTNCVPDSICDCDYIHRLLYALQYYISLNIIKNTFHSDIWTTFCHDIYSEFINDWIHIISIHSHQIHAIRSELISRFNVTKYATKETAIIKRHYHPEDDVRKYNQKQDVAFEFYRQRMDDIYFHIFYLQDLGLRVSDTNIDDMKDDEYDCIDYVFGTKKQTILNKRKRSDIGINPWNESNNRFNVPTLSQKHSEKTLESGLMFHYWPYYKDKDTYIERKYDTYKLEILAHMKVDRYEEILFKAQQYVATDKVRQYYSRKDDDDLHFDIKLSTPISISHLISLIVYCDFNIFCNAFRSSFVGRNVSESLLSIKERHSAYWFTAKYLRECVSYYGIEGKGIWDNDRCQYRDKICGPFYCGVNTVVYVSEFGVGLYLPQSTSKQMDIAINYTNMNGMIIALNTDGAYMDDVTIFDCSWISRYAEYDEYIFFGDDKKIQIQSIVLMDINKNFEMFMNAMYVFDCMMNGINTQNRMDITGNDVCIMTQLISQSNGFDQYINNTFKVYRVEKTEVVLNIHYLNEYYGAMNYLIMHSINKEYREDHVYDEYCVDNLLNVSIFSLFTNIKYVTIDTTNWLGTCCYVFSLSYFLNVLMSASCCNWIQINIKAVCKNNYYDLPQPTWISKLWSSSAVQIIAQYNQSNLNIFKQNHMSVNNEGHKEEVLVITRHA